MIKKPSLVKRFIYRLFGISDSYVLFLIGLNKTALIPVIDYFLVEDNFGNVSIAYGFSYVTYQNKKKKGESKRVFTGNIDVSFCKAICPGTNRSATKLVNRISEEVDYTGFIDKGRMDVITEYLGAKGVRVKEHILSSSKFLSKEEMLIRQPVCSAVAKQQILNM